MPKFLPTDGFKWIDHKKFDSNKCTSRSSKGSILEVDFEYPKELHQLHNDYRLLEFSQSSWLKLYVKLNTQKRI